MDIYIYIYMAYIFYLNFEILEFARITIAGLSIQCDGYIRFQHV